MLKLRYLMLVAIAVMVLVAACGGNKQVATTVIEPVLTPIQLARIAVAEGNEAFAEKEYDLAIKSYETAIMNFTEAEATASEADSISYNVEVLNINIAKTYSDMAVEAYTERDYVVAKEGFLNSINKYKSITPTTISSEEHKSLLIDLYRFLAYSNQQLGSYEDAIKSLDQLLLLSPGNEEALNLKFSILNDNIKDETRAYKVLIEYAEVSQDANAYITLANRYRDNNKNTEAAMYYEKALEIKSEPSVILLVAEFYRAISNWNRSTALFETILATKPDQEMTKALYRRIGENYSQADNRTKMVEYFEKYLAMERDPQIALMLSSHFNTAKNYNKVIQYATIVIGIDASNSDAIMLRGMAYYNLKRNNEAKADFQRIQNDPKHGANAKRFLAAIN